VLAVVGAVDEYPNDRSQAPHTLNTYVNASEVGNSTHRRVMNQPQETLLGYVVSACCKDRPGTVMSSLHLRR